MPPTLIRLTGPVVVGLAVALMGLAAPAAWAEVLHLRQAVEAALSQSPDLALTQAQTEQAEAAVRQAEGARLPSLTASVQATQSNDALAAFTFKMWQRDVSPADFDMARLNNPGESRDFNPRLEVQFPLYTGGLISSRIAQARAQAVAARHGDMQARQQLVQTVLEAYQGVHAARAQIRQAEAALAAAEETRRVAERLLREGVAVKSDVLSAQVAVEQARARLAEAQRHEGNALDQLKVLTGRPLAVPLDVGPEIVPDLPEGDLDTLRQTALAEQPGLKALRSQLESARAQIEAARSSQRPNLMLMGRQDWHDAGVGLGPSSYVVGGVLSWRLYDGGMSSGGVDRAQAEFHEAAARLRQAENTVTLRVADAWRRAQAAESRLTAQTAAVAQAEEAQRLVRKRYENGVANLTELLDAQSRLDRARAELVAARQDLVSGRAAVRCAIGTLTVDAL